MRAAHELEVGIVRVQAAQAALAAEKKAQAEALDRVRGRLGNVTSEGPPRRETETPAATEKKSLGELHKLLQEFLINAHEHEKRLTELREQGFALEKRVDKILKENPPGK